MLLVMVSIRSSAIAVMSVLGLRSDKVAQHGFAVGLDEAVVLARDVGLNHGVAVAGQVDVERRVAEGGVQLARPPCQAVVDLDMVVRVGKAVCAQKMGARFVLWR